MAHYFDCPYQRGEKIPDCPSNGTVLRNELFEGNIVLAITDGVFDNLSDNCICEALAYRIILNLSNISQAVADKLRAGSPNAKDKTPYKKLAQNNRYEEYRNGVGGKFDDISCVVLMIMLKKTAPTVYKEK